MAFVSSSSSCSCSMLIFILFIWGLAFHCSTSSSSNTLLSLSVENPKDVINSKNGMFTAGFHAVGDNAYCFAIWFTEPHHAHAQHLTLIWMANRDQPVNGRLSTLTLHDTGNLVLSDAGHSDVWATNTTSATPLTLLLRDDGNLVLLHTHHYDDAPNILWQSFEYPTDTLLPTQYLTRYTKLVSSTSQSNLSSGFYKLFFDNDNLLRLLYDGPDVSSVYWPDPWLVSWEAGRSSYNASRLAVLDSYGNFSSTDDLTFLTSDYGPSLIQRRLTLDCDGNVRVYGRSKWGEKWYVSWEAKSQPCKIHGVCGANSVCTYHQLSGIKCSCLPGYKVKNASDWSFGCDPKFNLSCNNSTDHHQSRFLHIGNSEFYGYDHGYFQNYTYNQCQDQCLKLCNCKAFQYTYDQNSGTYLCYTKTMLLNGYLSPGFQGSIYLRLPKASHFGFEESVMECKGVISVKLEREYTLRHNKVLVKVFMWLVLAVGGFEIVCLSVVSCLLMRTRKKGGSDDQHNYHLTATGFRSYSYSEMKEATKGFSEEIGRGGGGIVYKGVLRDQRVAAIKRLNEARQGESEFLAEVSIIGRLNHMNLIDMWGYCAEGKHRLLVYEYMDNGSLAQNLLSNSLDWKKRFDIALGTAM